MLNVSKITFTKRFTFKTKKHNTKVRKQFDPWKKTEKNLKLYLVFAKPKFGNL